MRITLSEIETVRFNADLWIATPEASNKLGPLLKSHTLMVQAKRPDCLRVESVSKKSDLGRHAEFVVNPYSTFISNGNTQIDYAPSSGSYVSSIATGELAKVRSSRGITLWLGLDILFSDNPLHGFRLRMKKSIDNKLVNCYTRKCFKFGLKVQENFYVEIRTGLPVRLEVHKVTSIWTRELITITNYTDWVLNPDLLGSDFDPTPPKGSSPESPRMFGEKEEMLNH